MTEPALRRAAAIPLPSARSAGPAAAACAVVDGGVLRLQLVNTGTSPLQLAVCSHHLTAEPVRHDLDPGEQKAAELATSDGGSYDIAVHGPDGFLRRLAGDTASTQAVVDASIEVTGAPDTPTVRLVLHSADGVTRSFHVSSRLGVSAAHRVPARSSKQLLFQPLQHDDGWYDLTAGLDGVTTWGRRFAGHLGSAARRRRG